MKQKKKIEYLEKDDIEHVAEALKKRDEILVKGKSIKLYNKYFDTMRKHAKRVIDAGRQDELLLLLDSDNVSYRHDIAGVLYHCYPEKCNQVLKEISEKGDVVDGNVKEIQKPRRTKSVSNK